MLGNLSLPSAKDLGTTLISDRLSLCKISCFFLRTLDALGLVKLENLASAHLGRETSKVESEMDVTRRDFAIYRYFLCPFTIHSYYLSVSLYLYLSIPSLFIQLWLYDTGITSSSSQNKKMISCHESHLNQFHKYITPSPSCGDTA